MQTATGFDRERQKDQLSSQQQQRHSEKSGKQDKIKGGNPLQMRGGPQAGVDRTQSTTKTSQVQGSTAKSQGTNPLKQSDLKPKTQNERDNSQTTPNKGITPPVTQRESLKISQTPVKEATSSQIMEDTSETTNWANVSDNSEIQRTLEDKTE